MFHKTVKDFFFLIKNFLDGPVAKTSPSNAEGIGSIPGQGAKTPHASWPKKPKHNTEVILQQIN